MTYPETGYQCHRCGMRFAIVQNFHLAKGEITWCATPNCHIRFWHGYAGQNEPKMKPCEVLQADLEAA